MGAQIREYRQRIRSVSATKKITRAMELMAASRVVKAQQAVRASSPYARALTRAVSAVATFSDVDHPLTTEHEQVRRAAVVTGGGGSGGVGHAPEPTGRPRARRRPPPRATAPCPTPTSTRPCV